MIRRFRLWLAHKIMPTPEFEYTSTDSTNVVVHPFYPRRRA